MVPPGGAMVTIARPPQEAICPQALDGLAIRSRVPHGTFQLPARLLVLDAPIIMLELGIALLAGLVGAAMLIEARDGKPGTVCTGLASLGVEASSKGILMGKLAYYGILSISLCRAVGLLSLE